MAVHSALGHTYGDLMKRLFHREKTKAQEEAK